MRLDHLLSKESSVGAIHNRPHNYGNVLRSGFLVEECGGLTLFNLEGVHPGYPFKAQRSGFEWEKETQGSEVRNSPGAVMNGADFAVTHGPIAQLARAHD